MILKHWRIMMISEIKDKVLEVWHNHKVCVLAATTAFVIGIILF